MHVTVLMAAYNEISNIEKSINSILQQTYHKWDLIVVDDYSTDGTYECLLRIAKANSQITVCRNEKNIGRAASRNRGWKKSKGEMIAIWDADDECYPDRLEKQVAFMKKHPEIDALGTGVELIGKNGQVQNTIFLSENDEQIKKDVFKKTLFFHSSVMMKKSFLIEVGGYDDNLLRGEDFELWVKGIKYGYRYHNLPVVLLKYKTNNYQRSFKNIIDKFFSSLIIAFRYNYFINGTGSAFVGFFKSILVHYGLYIPRAIRGEL